MKTKIATLIVVISVFLLSRQSVAGCYTNGSMCRTADKALAPQLTGWTLASGNENKICKVYYPTGNASHPSYQCIDPMAQVASQNNWCLSDLFEPSSYPYPLYYHYSYYVEYPNSGDLTSANIVQILTPIGDPEYKARNSFASLSGSCGTTHPSNAGVCGNGVQDQLIELCDDGNTRNDVGNCDAKCGNINSFSTYSRNICLTTARDVTTNTAHSNAYCKFLFQTSDASVEKYVYTETNGGRGHETSCYYTSADYSSLILGGRSYCLLGYVRCNPGSIPLHPKIEFTGPTQPVAAERANIAGTISIPSSTIVEYSIDSSAWTRVPRCDYEENLAHKLNFNIVTPKLVNGSHTIKMRVMTAYGYPFESNLYTFNIAKPLTTGMYPIVMKYNDALIGADANIDNDPLSNLYIYTRKGAGNWTPTLDTTIDRTGKTVSAKTTDLSGSFSVVYKSPSCVWNAN